jgi:hypothetical protein
MRRRQLLARSALSVIKTVAVLGRPARPFAKYFASPARRAQFGALRLVQLLPQLAILAREVLLLSGFLHRTQKLGLLHRLGDEVISSSLMASTAFQLCRDL